MFWPNFTFHKMKKKELLIPIAALAILLGSFYRQYRAGERLADLEAMMDAAAIDVAYGEGEETLADPQGFIQRYMLPADVTQTLRKAKFAPGASFKLRFVSADGESLGSFDFFPIKGEFDEDFPAMMWHDVKYVAKWGGYYYNFSTRDHDVMEELVPYLERLGVPEP